VIDELVYVVASWEMHFHTFTNLFTELKPHNLILYPESSFIDVHLHHSVFESIVINICVVIVSGLDAVNKG
jgi:hypothetical protein